MAQKSMTHSAQQEQHDLVEQGLADPRVAAAVQAYEAVRTFVPEQTYALSSAINSTSTTITTSASG